MCKLTNHKKTKLIKNLKTILTSGTLLLGSLALFAGCNNGDFPINNNIAKEVNWILNNPNPNQTESLSKGGRINNNQLFNIGDNVRQAIQQYEVNGTAINKFDPQNVNLSVKQVLAYSNSDINNNWHKTETTVLVNNLQAPLPTPTIFDKEGHNIANNFLLTFNYSVDAKGNIISINDAGSLDYFNNQSFGNSIDSYIDKKSSSSALKPIIVNKMYNSYEDVFSPYSNSTNMKNNNTGTLFIDQRTKDNKTLKDPKTLWSLPNAAYIAAVNTTKPKIITIKNKNAASDKKIHASILNLEIGYTDGLSFISKSPLFIFGLKAKKLTFSKFFLENNNKFVSIVANSDSPPQFKFKEDIQWSDLMFYLDNVNFNTPDNIYLGVSGDRYWGYSVSSIELVK